MRLTRPSNTTLIRVAVVVAAVSAVAWRLLLATPDGFDRPIVLASGRDDHGLLANPTVDLLDAPSGQVVGSVADGTLVEVLATEATWLRVRALTADGITGWVDDFHLRGTAHLVGEPPACPVATYGDDGASVYAAVPPSTQVELFDHHRTPDGAWVGVRPLGEEEIVLVPEDVVQELPGPAPVPGTACQTITPVPTARPHEH